MGQDRRGAALFETELNITVGYLNQCLTVALSDLKQRGEVKAGDSPLLKIIFILGKVKLSFCSVGTCTL